MNVPGFESGRSFFDQEAADLFVLAFRPDQRHIRDRAVGDPHFFAVEDVAIALFHGAGQHSAGIGAELRFREPEASDRFPLLQLRQPFFLLCVRPERVNRIHHQRRLHRYEAPQARIAPLKLLRHQPVFHIGHFRAAVAFEARSEKSELRHLRHKLHGKFPRAIMLRDDGKHLLVHKLTRGLSRQLLFIAEQGIELEEIDARERGH